MIKKILPHLLVILLSIIVTIIFTWPFASKLNSFYYDRGDYQTSGAILSYNAHSIETGRIFNSNEYFNGFQYYPQPYALIYFDFRLLPSLIYSPIFWITQNFILSVNLTTFLTFVLSFISAFYAINYFVKNSFASIIGAIVFAFNPLTFSRFPEHFDLLNKYLIPLVFLFAYKFLRFPNIKNSFLFFLVFTLNAFSAIYFQIFTTVMLIFFTIPFFIYQISRRDLKYFIKIFILSFIFLIFLPIFLYFSKPYWDFSKAEGMERSINDNIYFSARVIDYVSSTKQNLLYGNFTKSLDNFRAPKDNNGNFNYLEHSLFLNIIPMLLFGIFIFYLVKKEVFLGNVNKKIMFFSYSVLLLVTFILSFGPYFQGWNSQMSTSFKLPYYYLYQILPLLKASRAPARLEFLFYVPFSLFVSFGSYFLFKKINNKKMILALFIIILSGLFLENFNIDGPVVSYQEKSSVVPKVIAMNFQNRLKFLENKNTLHYPTLSTKVGIDSIYLNWGAITGEKIVNGTAASYTPSDQQLFLTEISEKFDEKIIKKSLVLGIDYIIIHKDLIDQKLKSDDMFNKLILKGSVLNEEDILILDTRKYGIVFTKCDFNKDFDISMQNFINPENIQKVDVLVLKNKSNCYLPSIYFDRYKQYSFYSTGLFGNSNKHTAFFKMPIIIEPYQQIVLSEITGYLRIE